ncbi:bifunctional molybdopterin-guanine dinucleotide biosynthesis protein MobB/MoaE [Natrialba hulunbeirensis JCM 10989]|uniref:Bifunctional molybdopterin-guanine dinucleotide biosynthesis protein MobB/MoaE n=1 Tax=Natrialba hulunbeirensis JCM 10989 TaxID=1227493 RepID=M0A1Z1_9EURY|nr:molybdopterin synthase [Natrialba hulunbeirensis]ELY92780.1 bifunctional molybdopterin-guanine dinucleotide biosynthesis protein MobB/MoaE [Natrialba hulunbeirensis JCM 10989]
MHVLGILGRGVDETTLDGVVDRAVDELAQDGRVGVIRYDATIADGTHETLTIGGDVTYGLGADGDWTATGTGLSVQDAIDQLATNCDYGVVVGVPSLQRRYPTLIVGSDADTDRAESNDRAHSLDHAQNTLATIDSPTDLDTLALTTALESTEPHRTLESLVSEVKHSPQAPRAGAIATFTGRVRQKDTEDDTPTEYLEFEKYEGVADERMAALESELEAREGVFAVELYHRTGVVEDGEDIVFVVVLAGHREEAFRTVEDGINRLKDEVPLFKKEVTIEDEFWVHEQSKSHHE